eukprot:scaffold13555_cov38-Cyclotella_meneghiniana.AAC.9
MPLPPQPWYPWPLATRDSLMPPPQIDANPFLHLPPFLCGRFKWKTKSLYLQHSTVHVSCQEFTIHISQFIPANCSTYPPAPDAPSPGSS